MEGKTQQASGIKVAEWSVAVGEEESSEGRDEEIVPLLRRDAREKLQAQCCLSGWTSVTRAGSHRTCALCRGG